LRLLAQAVGSDALRTSGEHAGFHLLWWLPDGIDAAALRDQARAGGLALQPVLDYCRRAAMPAGLVIGYSGLDERELARQGALLGPLLRGAARP